MFIIVKDKPGQCRLSILEQATSSVEMWETDEAVSPEACRK